MVRGQAVAPPCSTLLLLLDVLPWCLPAGDRCPAPCSLLGAPGNASADTWDWCLCSAGEEALTLQVASEFPTQLPRVEGLQASPCRCGLWASALPPSPPSRPPQAPVAGFGLQLPPGLQQQGSGGGLWVSAPGLRLWALDQGSGARAWQNCQSGRQQKLVAALRGHQKLCYENPWPRG